MNNKKLNISGYSTALFSTWFFVEELGLLFDAGEGLTSSLLQKSRKIKHAFISHADRDHLGGLFQFNQLNARPGFPIIHYPADCGSFPAIEKFVEKFDPHVKGTVWNPISNNEKILINKETEVISLKNNHVKTPEGKHKSFGYKVFKTKRKLKEEYKNLSSDEIKIIVQKEGREHLTSEVRDCILGYSGDTPVDELSNWNNTQILIHEATFLDNQVGLNPHANKHSNLEEVLEMVSNINVDNLILSHFSSRYSAEEIDAKIRMLCQKFNIKIPVFRILPGEVSRNILNDSPINL